MDKRDEGVTLTCFHCGSTREGNYEDTFSIHPCEVCGETGMLTCETAMDLLNDLYLKGKWKPYEDLEDTDDLEFDYE